MSERINVTFVERHLGEDPLIIEDYLCVFYLIDDGKGNPGLTLESDGKGEVMIIDQDQDQSNKETKELSRKRKRK